MEMLRCICGSFELPNISSWDLLCLFVIVLCLLTVDQKCHPFEITQLHLYLGTWYFFFFNTQDLQEERRESMGWI